MFKLRTSLLAVTIVLLFEAVISENVKGTNGTNEFSENEGSRVLSRRKRFLIFPDGSSLQLVFCCQTAALIPIGDIFLYGSTAALAWVLPTDPMLLTSLKEKEFQRRGDTNIKFLNEEGRVIATVPYRRKLIVNPAFAKRSINNMSFKEKLKLRLEKSKMHQDHSHREYLKDMDERSIEFHRSSRLELFEKIEKLIGAVLVNLLTLRELQILSIITNKIVKTLGLGQNGRACVLYKLCEAAQIRSQGTFLQEFLRVVFTLPKGIEFDEEHHKEYDRAHTAAHDCMVKYPGCNLITQ